MRRFVLSLLVAIAFLYGAKTAHAQPFLFYAGIENRSSYGNADIGVSLRYGISGMKWAMHGVPTLFGEHSPYAFSYSTPGAQPVTFDEPFTLRLWISELYDEYHPPHEGTLDFTGRLSGTLSENASTVRLTFSDQTRTVNVGNHDFLARPLSVDIPPPGGEPFALPLELTVRAAQAPEPSTLALGLIAAMGVAARRWRRRSHPA